MRSDAQRNRERVLAAADRVFEQEGPDGSTDAVARRAGLGVATVFRHFPTKRDLLTAVLVRRLDSLRGLAETQLDATEPFAALEAFFHAVVRSAPTKLAIADALERGAAEAPALPDPAMEAGRCLAAAVSALVTRAQASDRIRLDVSGADVFALMIGVSRSAAFLRLSTSTAQRLVGVTLDGLRIQPSAENTPFRDDHAHRGHKDKPFEETSQ